MRTSLRRFVFSAGVVVAGFFVGALPAYAGVPGLISAKITGPNTITVMYSEPVNANAGDYSNFTGSLASRSVSSLGGNGTNTITLTLNGDPLPANATGYMNVGSNTASVSDRSPFPGGVFSVIDAQAPSLVSVSMSSLDGTTAIGTMLKTITINFSTNESVAAISASVLGHTIPLTGNGSGPYIISYTMAGGDTVGTVPVSLSFTDSASNVGHASFTVSTGASSATTSAYVNNITSNANTPGVLRIGDSITFTLTPSVMQPNARVNGSYNGVPLSWYTNNGGVSYIANYVVSAGNADQPYPLQITGVTLTDQFGSTGASMSSLDVAKTIVASSPSIYEMMPVPTLATTPTPKYSFNSSKGGTIRFSGDCSSVTNYASVGANTITFNTLANGLHNNCTIAVTDSAGNMSNQITLAPFTVLSGATPAPTTPVAPAVNPSASDLATQLAALQNQLAMAQGTSGRYVFTKALDIGASGDEVLELQKRLKSEGYLTATPNGNYGPATQAAVKAYQRAHGLSPLGIVGPGTRAALNK